jgi:hypothetical protein
MAEDQRLDIDGVLAARPNIGAHVVHRAFVTETVVLNLETGKYHGLNPIAGRMLEALGRAPTVAAAADEVAAHYGEPVDEVRQDLVELCTDLVQRGLIELDAA